MKHQSLFCVVVASLLTGCVHHEERMSAWETMTTPASFKESLGLGNDKSVVLYSFGIRDTQKCLVVAMDPADAIKVRAFDWKTEADVRAIAKSMNSGKAGKIVTQSGDIYTVTKDYIIEGPVAADDPSSDCLFVANNPVVVYMISLDK